MKLLSNCEICKKRKLLIRRRPYTHKRVGLIKSKDEICGGCFRKIKKALANDETNNN